ncbi:squalene--hopene cyclase [Nocardioides sp. CER19]|uniref:squalene--hopene cyclase n=1 Tax=Nocardioides sp. CER19 TaxID=3038538 RepID=UPI002448546C|nr:squalene--hopene cyclase [Nocardioides sp. CER19]MDH2414481.1 squalene--hopene cyclase [Nocardioides sp. CER19]
MTANPHAPEPVLIASTLPVPPPSGAPDTAAARATLDAAVVHLRSLQHPDGWWKGDLATNVTMDAEDLMLRTFLRVATPETTEQTARWIRSQQRSDGTWALYPGGPGDLSTTVEAWVALRIAGDPAESVHLQKAAAYIRDSGGLESARVFTHLWLALFGLWRWDDCPTLPPELILLPKRAPLNIYNWGCWARQTIVPLTIVSSRRPVRQVGIRVDELRSGAEPPRTDPLWTLAGGFQRLDRGLRAFGKLLPSSRNPVRRIAERQAAEWILARQEADGGWGGIQPPWVYSLLALHVLGYPVDHPAMAAGIRGLDGFTVHAETDEGPVRWLEACQSPVWDTGLAVTALLEAGVPGDDPAVLTAAGWLLDEQITAGGDWQVRRPELPSGGWAFEFANDAYPDTDDTAEIVMALRRVRHPDCERLNKAVDRAIAWTVGMQSADGGWGAFDADNTHELPLALPFCDFGAVIDPPSADVTAHVVEMMATAGLVDRPECRRGVAWLLDAQEPDGSWFGRWGAHHVYGTGAVVPALVAAGIPAHDPHVRWATEWLRRHQNDDGGWGEDLRSYDDPDWVGRGESTPSQTAWALLALLAAGDSPDAVERGIRYLVSTQLPDGSWAEELYTGTGFPGDFYIGYGLYRQVFPLWALGRYLAGRADSGGGERP